MNTLIESHGRKVITKKKERKEHAITFKLEQIT